MVNKGENYRDDVAGSDWRSPRAIYPAAESCLTERTPTYNFAANESYDTAVMTSSPEDVENMTSSIRPPTWSVLMRSTSLPLAIRTDSISQSAAYVITIIALHSNNSQTEQRVYVFHFLIKTRFSIIICLLAKSQCHNYIYKSVNRKGAHRRRHVAINSE